MSVPPPRLLFVYPSTPTAYPLPSLSYLVRSLPTLLQRHPSWTKYSLTRTTPHYRTPLSLTHTNSLSVPLAVPVLDFLSSPSPSVLALLVTYQDPPPRRRHDSYSPVLRGPSGPSPGFTTSAPSVTTFVSPTTVPGLSQGSLPLSLLPLFLVSVKGSLLLSYLPLFLIPSGGLTTPVSTCRYRCLTYHCSWSLSGVHYP